MIILDVISKFKLITLKIECDIMYSYQNAYYGAVNIDSGFFEETKSEDGLAHYLEHIIAKHLKKVLLNNYKRKIFTLILTQQYVQN